MDLLSLLLGHNCVKLLLDLRDIFFILNLSGNTDKISSPIKNKSCKTTLFKIIMNNNLTSLIFAIRSYSIFNQDKNLIALFEMISNLQGFALGAKFLLEEKEEPELIISLQ